MRSYTLLPILALAAAKNVTIDVGKIGPRVTPDTVSANVGDTYVNIPPAESFLQEPSN